VAPPTSRAQWTDPQIRSRAVGDEVPRRRLQTLSLRSSRSGDIRRGTSDSLLSLRRCSSGWGRRGTAQAFGYRVPVGSPDRDTRGCTVLSVLRVYRSSRISSLFPSLSLFSGLQRLRADIDASSKDPSETRHGLGTAHPRVALRGRGLRRRRAAIGPVRTAGRRLKPFRIASPWDCGFLRDVHCCVLSSEHGQHFRCAGP